MKEGKLRLSDLEPERGRRVAVDLFLRTLAEAQGQSSIGIVLSGADTDGAIGIKRIKEQGGLTIAQEPTEAEHPGMPRAAIATGMVDWVLPVGEMPERLIEFLNNGRRLHLPEGATHRPESQTAPRTPAGAGATLQEVLSFLRARTGRDFSCYKHATILRRVRRRMQVNGIESLPDYVGFLRKETGEPSALVQDLLVALPISFGITLRSKRSQPRCLGSSRTTPIQAKLGCGCLVVLPGKKLTQLQYSFQNTLPVWRSRHQSKYSQLICMRTPFAWHARDFIPTR
jgi:two-component system CheB/CheR fusion protein